MLIIDHRWIGYYFLIDILNNVLTTDNVIYNINLIININLITKLLIMLFQAKLFRRQCLGVVASTGTVLLTSVYGQTTWFELQFAETPGRNEGTVFETRRNWHFLIVWHRQNVLRFWLDIGVDGFRVDALPFIVEDDSFRDEPLISPNTVDDNHTYFLLDHIYSRDQLGTYKIVEEFRAVLDEYTNRDGNTRYS